MPLASLIVGVVSAAISLRSFRLNRRRPRLRYDITGRELKAGASKLVVDGIEVKHPHEVTVWLQLTDAKDDIQPSHFDENKPLTIDLGARLVAEPTTDPAGLLLKRTGDRTQVQVVPQLIARKRLIYSTLLVDGQPRPKFVGDIANVDTVRFSAESAGSRVITNRTAIGLIAAGLAVCLLAFGGGIFFWYGISLSGEGRTGTASNDSTIFGVPAPSLFGFAGQGSPSGAATGTVMQRTQKMSEPNLTSDQLGWHEKGTVVSLFCFKRGQPVQGHFSFNIPGGWDDLWYKTADGSYIADVDVETGTLEPVTGDCAVLCAK